MQGRLGPQQTSLHNKHPIRKCELLEAQTLGPQVKWYFNLFEECLSLSISSLENVKFRLGDPDSVLGEEAHIGAGRFLQWGTNTHQLSMGLKNIPTYSLVLKFFQIINFDTIITVLEFL